MDVYAAITRRRVALTARLEVMDLERQGIEAELAELDAVREALRRLRAVEDGEHKRSGPMQSLVLACVREAHPRGVGVRAISARMWHDHGVIMTPDDINHLLRQSARAGHARRSERAWYYVTEDDRRRLSGPEDVATEEVPLEAGTEALSDADD